MAFQKGQSGNPKGRPTSEKAFADALRIAVKSQDETGKPKLRAIAEKLVTEALKGESWAIQQVADRLDGKPAQESTVTMEIRRAAELSDDELADIAAGSSEGTADAPIDPAQLN